MKDKKKILWLIVFLLLIGLTLFTIIQQSESFSFGGFMDFISTASWQWILLAFLSMFGFVIFEGLALLILCKAFGYKGTFQRGLVYSVTDIYFSAITPSATGGQPVSAYFMMKDKVPGAVTTIILLINLTLYTSSNIIMAIFCFLIRPKSILQFGLLSKCMIMVGFAVQFILITVFMLLVYKEKIVMKAAAFSMRILSKLHLIHNVEKKQEHLVEVEQQYKECASAVKTHKKALVFALLCNLLQRFSQIMVSVCVYIAKGGQVSKIFDVFATQTHVVLGSNSVPIPGAVGAADYLFIDGFRNIVQDPVSIELLSRGISFYCCVLICGIATLIIYFNQGLKGIKQKKK